MDTSYLQNSGYPNLSNYADVFFPVESDKISVKTCQLISKSRCFRDT